MKNILVTQRVVTHTEYWEKRDALDQRWFPFLEKCAAVPHLLPNHLSTVKKIVEGSKPDGILLTAGGECPERDAVEFFLIEYALKETIPLIGVGRGMQNLQKYFGVPLVRVKGHICNSQIIQVRGVPQEVNSFHEWGTLDSGDEFVPWAFAQDGVVKAVQHRSWPIIGMMWQPERVQPFAERDISIFRNHFKTNILERKTSPSANVHI